MLYTCDARIIEWGNTWDAAVLIESANQSNYTRKIPFIDDQLNRIIVHPLGMQYISVQEKKKHVYFSKMHNAAHQLAIISE